MRSFIAALCLWAGVEAVTRRGSCADHAVVGMENFDEEAWIGKEDFNGNWYEIAKDADFYDAGKSCSSEHYQRKFNGELVLALNKYDLQNKWSQDVQNTIHTFRDGEYAIFSEGQVGDRDASTAKIILATDYINYAIEYVCVDIVAGKLFAESVSIKARQP